MALIRQQTPNPNALKFILPQKMFDAPRSFPSAESASGDPLAARIFSTGAIYNVFMVQDFITVNKLPHVDWEPLATEIEQTVAEHFNLETTD